MAAVLATPALAKNDKNPGKDAKASSYAKATDAEKLQMRLTTLEKASKIHQKRDAARHQVDAKMQIRLKNIKADNPGDIGPVGR